LDELLLDEPELEREADCEEELELDDSLTEVLVVDDSRFELLVEVDLPLSVEEPTLLGLL